MPFRFTFCYIASAATLVSSAPMIAVASPPPLLLDNERLRELMREREQWPAGAASHQAAIVRTLVKPEQLDRVAATAMPERTTEGSTWPQQHWPGLLRQLHWELCSSTQLRPIAKIMDRTALLPDPFTAQGGLWQSGWTGNILPQHPATRLHTALRLDVILNGSMEVHIDDSKSFLIAGDALLRDALLPVYFDSSPDLRVWTEFYYSPEACCCRSSAPHDTKA
jgi:hypothetical protein